MKIPVSFVELELELELEVFEVEADPSWDRVLRVSIESGTAPTQGRSSRENPMMPVHSWLALNSRSTNPGPSGVYLLKELQGCLKRTQFVHLLSPALGVAPEHLIWFASVSDSRCHGRENWQERVNVEADMPKRER